MLAHCRTLFAILALSCVLLPSAATAREVPAKQIYEQTIRATAFIYNPSNNTTGTGWIVSKTERLLITNHHVIDGATKVNVIFPAFKDGRVVAERSFYDRADDLKKQGLFVQGRVLDSNSRRDLALVQLESLPKGVTALALAEESSGPAERVHLIGNPGVSTALWIYSQGLVRQVSDKNMWYSNGQFLSTRVVESTLPTNGGDSGSPVVNDEGKLVAVHSGNNRTAQLLSFSIDVKDVQTYLRTVTGLVRPKAANDHYRLANRFYLEKNWVEAEKSYRQALSLNAKTSYVYVDLAATLFQQGKRTEGQEALEQAIARGDKMAKLWKEQGGDRGALGLPVAPLRKDNPSLESSEAMVRGFQNGAMFHLIKGKQEGKVVAIHGPIARKYLDLSERHLRLGYPIGLEEAAKDAPTGTHGRFQAFEGGVIALHGDGARKGQAFAVLGQIGRLFASLGGTASKLGFPLSDEFNLDNGQRANFEGGHILFNAKDGAKAIFGGTAVAGR